MQRQVSDRLLNTRPRPAFLDEDDQWNLSTIDRHWKPKIQRRNSRRNSDWKDIVGSRDKSSKHLTANIIVGTDCGNPTDSPSSNKNKAWRDSTKELPVQEDDTSESVERFEESIFDDQDVILVLDGPQAKRVKRGSSQWYQRLLPKRRNSRKKWSDEDFFC